jgi:hypothetical protein
VGRLSRRTENLRVIPSAIRVSLTVAAIATPVLSAGLTPPRGKPRLSVGLDPEPKFKIQIDEEGI